MKIDLDSATWRRSGRCDNSGPNCVEVAVTPNGVAIRDSKDPNGPALSFTQDEWDAFKGGIEDGDF